MFLYSAHTVGWDMDVLNSIFSSILGILLGLRIAMWLSKDKRSLWTVIKWIFK